MSRLHVERWGEGARAIFGFHGWSGDHRTFLPLVPHLGPAVSLFAFDQPGFGQSSAPTRWDFETLIEPMFRFIEASGFESVELVGNCSGAFPALHTALRLGPRVRRVVLIDAFAFVPWYFRWLTTEPWGTFFYRSTFANPLGRFITNVALAERRASETHLTQAFNKVDHDHAHAFLKLLCSQENVRPFAPVTGAIDLVFGGRSFAAVKASIPEWQAIWPRAAVHELRDAGHLPIEEATAELAQILFDRVRALGLDPSTSGAGNVRFDSAFGGPHGN